MRGKSISSRPDDKFKSVFGVLIASISDQTELFTKKTNRSIVNHHFEPNDAIRLFSNQFVFLFMSTQDWSASSLLSEFAFRPGLNYFSLSPV